MNKPTVAVFDIGNVLVDWQPHLAWMDEFETRAEAEAFMARIDFPALNLRGDGGETFDAMANEISDPADARRFRAYLDRYALTIPNPIEGTWEIIARLKDRGTPVHAITNWSAETWPIGVAVHPRLGEVFGTTIVSGQERVLKPEARIFELLCQRADVAAAECVFIDDRSDNVTGAKAAGMDAILFTDPPSLELEFASRGML